MKQEEPILVAIHCLVYNHEPYLRDCFEGFVMQKTNFRFVAIVHDDASSDKSADIIREYEVKYPDIFRPIYEKENQWSNHDGSLENIMQKAIEATEAKYVAMCEGDDYWTDPYKLQKQVDILEQDDTLIAVVTNSSIVDNNKNVLHDSFEKVVKNNKQGRYDLREFFHEVHRYPTATVLYRNCPAHEIYQKYLVTRNNFLGDWTLWIVLHTYGDFYYLNQITTAYRINPTSITHNHLNARRLGLAKAQFDIIRSVQSILPEKYNDIKEELNKTAWMYFQLANAYKHLHKYFSMLWALILCEIKEPGYLAKFFINKYLKRNL